MYINMNTLNTQFFSKDTDSILKHGNTEIFLLKSFFMRICIHIIKIHNNIKKR